MTEPPRPAAPSEATFARYLAGMASDEERVAVEVWAAADPGHRERLMMLEEAWAAARGVPTEAERRSARASVLARIGAEAPPSLHLVSGSTPPGAMPRFVGAPGRGHRLGWAAVGGAAAVAAAVVVAFGLRASPRHGGAPVGLAMAEYVTAAGERATVTLLDGTRVVLAPASRVRVAMSGDRGARDVYLDGEAMFAVQHDVARPFTVHTATAETRDIGTAFDVRAYSGEVGTRVVVREGRVALHAATSRGVVRDSAVIGAGELGRVGEDGALASVRRVSADDYDSWVNGRLVFAYTPLREALPELGRWYGLDVQLADSSLGDRQISATFTTESPTQVLGMLATSTGLRFERNGKTVTVRR